VCSSDLINGTVTGAVIQSIGRYKGAYYFDGNDYIETLADNKLNLSNDFTLTMWFYGNLTNAKQNYNNPSGNLVQLLWRQDDAPGLAISNASGTPRVRVIILNATASPGFTSSTNLVSNTWNFAAFTYNLSAKTGKLYLNGALDSSSTAMGGGNAGATANYFRIGRDDAGRYFNGTIDDVRIYNKTLSYDEVNLVYKDKFNTDGNFTVSFWAKINKFTTDKLYVAYTIGDLNSNNDVAFNIGNSGGNNYANLAKWNGTGWQNGIYFSNTEIVAGVWNNYIGMWNGTSLIVYINGVYKNQSRFLGTKGNTTGEFVLLGDETVFRTPVDAINFNGSIDDFRFFDRIVTADEANKIYSESQHISLKLGPTWQVSSYSNNYLSNTKLWMWADYNCSYSTWRLWQPDLYFKYCCQDCICSEDLT
jgi:hypothetical protein